MELNGTDVRAIEADKTLADLRRRATALPETLSDGGDTIVLPRATLKADVMIVATAKIAGAAAFYSHETKVRRLADMAVIVGKDLPTHSEDLFIDAESREAAEDDEEPSETS